MISGDFLREARLRAGLTQRELARRARTSQSAIARWESGEVLPSFERLRELVRACGLELTVGLATYDDSYDEWILRALERTPTERVEDADSREREYESIREPTTSPVRSDLGIRAPLTALERHGVRYLVIGAVAAIAQAYPLTTNDLDVTPARDAENIERVVSALRDLEARLRTPTEPVDFPIDAKMIAAGEAWTLQTNAGPLGLVFRPAGTSGFDDLRRDALELDLGTGTPVLVASLRDVIRMKEASNREKDRARLPALRRTLELVRERERRDRDG